MFSKETGRCGGCGFVIGCQVDPRERQREEGAWRIILRHARHETAREEAAPKMDVTLRPATRDDIPDLSRLHMLGAHGLIDAVYQDALPGLPTNEIFERVLALI